MHPERFERKNQEGTGPDFRHSRANCSATLHGVVEPDAAITQTRRSHNVTSVRLTILDFVLTRFVINPKEVGKL
jgi:hypothetical protein